MFPIVIGWIAQKDGSDKDIYGSNGFASWKR